MSPMVPLADREERAEEMVRLADTAGLEVRGHLLQVRESPDPGFFVGKGKIEEIRVAMSELGAAVLVFNSDLTPVQIRNIERATNARPVDRTQLILDIFAARARTGEGKLQVELAQMLYALPRLTGRGKVLSRLGGGIGTRGPGETKLEVDRRRMRRRIRDLRKEIDAIGERREIQRSRRRAVPCPVIALVGYTNSGKSTLLNSLTGAGVLAEDRLFATLDPTVRRVALPSGQDALLIDTVGFIRDLPHELVAAFRATLEEVLEADVLVHVVDASSAAYPQQMEVVSGLLRSLGAGDRPVVTVFNKCDLRPVPDAVLEQYAPAVRISALTGAGLDSLLAAVDERLGVDRQEEELLIPYSMQALMSLIHSNGKISEIDYLADGIRVRAVLPRVWSRRIRSRIEQDGTHDCGAREAGPS
ncbi:MAG: GTPase HflX [Firmicutes bacterium]|nr:GTPase HflX [Bacillota bacterium]